MPITPSNGTPPGEWEGETLATEWEGWVAAATRAAVETTETAKVNSCPQNRQNIVNAYSSFFRRATTAPGGEGAPEGGVAAGDFRSCVWQ